MIRSGIITYIIIVLACLSPNMATSVHAQNWIYRYTHIGNQRFHKGQTDKAEQYYLRLLKEAPNNSRAMFNLADAYLAKGDVKGADSLYNKVTQIETNPQVRSMAWHNRGYISQRAALQSREQEQQLLRTAIEQYKQALRLEPHSDRTRYNLALCQKQLKESTNNKQQNKQQQKQQQQQKNKQNEQQQQQQQQQKNNSNKQQDKQQTEQYMNLARQAERRALEKLKQHQPKQRSKDKNW
jgi:Ca-activated chloride channel family protein